MIDDDNHDDVIVLNGQVLNTIRLHVPRRTVRLQHWICLKTMKLMSYLDLSAPRVSYNTWHQTRRYMGIGSWQLAPNLRLIPSLCRTLSIIVPNLNFVFLFVSYGTFPVRALWRYSLRFCWKTTLWHTHIGRCRGDPRNFAECRAKFGNTWSARNCGPNYFHLAVDKPVSR